MSSDDPNKTSDSPEGAGPITLDRYLSKRRPVQKTGWVQIVSMIAMLGALIMIMVYKDSCGRHVSQLLGGPPAATTDAGPAGPGSASRSLPPRVTPTKPAPPSSVPASPTPPNKPAN